MLIDCHLHTSRYSSCSRLDPFEACELALKRGLDALVITEHQIQWTPQEVRELQGFFPELALYSGLEVTLEEGVDVVVITRNQGLEVDFGLPLQEVLSLLGPDRASSFLFLAHAFRWTRIRTPGMDQVLAEMDGMEMSSVNILAGQCRLVQDRFLPDALEDYEQALEDFNLIPVYNTDAHMGLAVGSIVNEIPQTSQPDDETELAALLKESRPEERQNRKLLSKILS